MIPTYDLGHEFVDGAIDGVVVEPIDKYSDERGWLAEFYRLDQLSEDYAPAMAYVSFSRPGILRGPHEHHSQADMFAFVGPSNFLVRLWDNRPNSGSYRNRMSLTVGEEKPTRIIVPPGVVHAYVNVGDIEGMIINCPNQLYMGEGKKHPIDEIRHEDDPDTIFRMDDPT